MKTLLSLSFLFLLGINIPFDEAYGPRNPEMLVEFPREKFPKDMQLEVGMPLMMNNGADQQFQVVVTEIKEEVVILDANHPLAGQATRILFCVNSSCCI